MDGGFEDDMRTEDYATRNPLVPVNGDSSTCREVTRDVRTLNEVKGITDQDRAEDTDQLRPREEAGSTVESLQLYDMSIYDTGLSFSSTL